MAVGISGGILTFHEEIELLHFGKLAGLPNKILWFALGLTPAFMYASGVVMWWNRKRGARCVPVTRPAPSGERAAEDIARVREP